MTDAEYDLLKRHVLSAFKVDLDAYKPRQMRRRLEALALRRASDVGRYCAALATDPALLEELRNAITINVSEFFRDVAQFKRLETQVLPELLKRSPRGITVWSAACSTGEEPYSIAMIAHDLGATHRTRIIATDIDRAALARARSGGPYPEEHLRYVRPDRIERFFRHDADGWWVAEPFRRRVDFREVNLLSGAFGRGYDLIVCRNVLIYFNEETKRRLFAQFHAALSEGGVLFVGGTEAMVGADGAGYERIGGNFYRKAGGPVGAALHRASA